MKEFLIAMNQRPIAFYPIYAKITGNVKRGILLSQLMYWWAIKNGDEFYKTDAEILAETALSANELRGAKRALKQMDFIEIKAKGVPVKTWYKIHYSELVKSIKSNSLKSPNLFSDNHQIENVKITNSLTENTTENTQRILTEIPKNKFSGDISENPIIEICPTFDDFWNLYDKKVGSITKLKKKFDKLNQSTREHIMDYVAEYVKATPDKQFRKHPSTFLNQKGWLDEIIISQKSEQKSMAEIFIKKYAHEQGVTENQSE